MPIRTTLRTKYIVRMVIIAIVCIVFGLWGLYDYFVTIPKKEKQHARGQIFSLVLHALESSRNEEVSEDLKAERIQNAGKAVVNSAQTIEAEYLEHQDPQDVNWEEIRAAMDETGDLAWLAMLRGFQAALVEASQLPLTEEPSPGFVTAVELARSGDTNFGNIAKPAKYDRIIKGAVFFPCLPMGLYMFYPLLRKRREIYQLDEDGTFSFPNGEWPRDEIADVDMSKWMAKSIAHVVHTDGTRIKLDDYIFTNVHLLVGALAAEMYPEEWDEQAKPVTEEEPEELEAEDDEAIGDEAEAAGSEPEDEPALAEDAEEDDPRS